MCLELFDMTVVRKVDGRNGPCSIILGMSLEHVLSANRRDLAEKGIETQKRWDPSYKSRSLFSQEQKHTKALFP